MSQEQRVSVHIRVEVDDDKHIDVTRECYSNWEGRKIDPKDLLADTYLEVSKTLSERMNGS